jgi:AraC-like DNA-binding protein
VAHAVGLSKSHFSVAFKQATGSTVEQFILRRRLANGIALLCDLRLTIKEVAALVGFTDAGNFSRTFHRATGYTPSECRASLQEKLPPRS